jgi:aminoglycoside phosphotransferase (APT) family kinase protein
MSLLRPIQLIQLIAAALSQGGQIARDALGDRTGSSLSYDPQQICEPAALSALINNNATDIVAAPVVLLGVELLDVLSPSSNCNNLVIRIEQAAGKAVLPETLFIKLPSPELVTRWFFNIIESWKLESHFFRHVAHTLPIRTPKTYAVATQGSRFCLVQEDLNADPSVQLFTNFDMLEGPPMERVRRCLDTFARLHATHYDLSEQQRLNILPLDRHPMLGRNMRALSPKLNRISLNPCRKKAPGIISDELAALYRTTLANWDSLLDYWYSGNMSLCHGDSHLGNFFASGDEMGMLDFQAVHWGHGIRDVQYFLIDSLPSETLAAHEQELVQYYVDRRAIHGTAIDFDTTWEQYRSLTFQTWMTIVVSIGLAAMNEDQDALMIEILRRSVAAIQRVDYQGWLEDFLQAQ